MLTMIKKNHLGRVEKDTPRMYKEVVYLKDMKIMFRVFQNTVIIIN